ncbi:MAG: hypothetical protein ACRD59_12430 [Candidatus Acidiferrales bacterium]
MTRRTIEILAVCISLLVATLAFHAWLSSHDDQLRLQSTLASQKLVLDAADARERDRNATLKDTLAQIESLKRQVQTPEQILRELPKYLPLPQPITLSNESSANARASTPHTDPNTITEAATNSGADQQGTPTAPQRLAPIAARQGTTSSAKTASSAKTWLNALLHPSQRGAFAGGAPSATQSALPGSGQQSSVHPGQTPQSQLGSRAPDAQLSSNSSPQSQTSQDTNNRGTIAPAEATPALSILPDPAHDAGTANFHESSPHAAAQPLIPPATAPTSSAAQIPTADLKPLFDFVQECRTCQIQLTAAKQDAADNAQKITALTRERDAAVTAAKGGTLWLRLRRNSHWLAIGAAVSAGLLCAASHCR